MGWLSQEMLDWLAGLEQTDAGRAASTAEQLAQLLSGGKAMDLSVLPNLTGSVYSKLVEVHSNLQRLKEAGLPIGNPRVVPVFGVPCTELDFPLLLGQMVHLDVGVARFVVIVNGPGIAPRIILRALQLSLGENFFMPFFWDANEGVARAWNRIIAEGMQHMAPQARYVVIANADVTPFPSMLAPFLEETYHHCDYLVVNRFAHFALFAVTRFGFSELGLFDEVLYPAYMEDVEFHLRAVSKGIGDSDRFGLSGSNEVNRVFCHSTATNMGRNRALRKMIRSFPREMYVLRKWGIHEKSVTALFGFQHSWPHRFPFNNPKIRHNNSWVVDQQHRACLKAGEPECNYNYELVKKLEIDGPVGSVK